MANPYQPGPIAGGVERLVGALMGGDEAEAAGYQAAATNAMKMRGMEADTERKVTLALKEKEERMALLRAEQDIAAANPELAPEAVKVMATLIHANRSSAIKPMQEYAIRDRLPAMYEAEGMNPANALAASYSPKPLKSVDIDSGHIIRDPYSMNPAVALTEKESATVETQNARTGLVGAQTANANARTDQVRDKTANPGRYRAPGKGKASAELVGHPGSGLKPDAQDMIDFATDPKGLKDSFIEAFGYDAYLSALQSVPTLKPHVFRKRPTAADTAALRDRKMAPEDFIEKFGQPAYDAARESLKGAKK